MDLSYTIEELLNLGIIEDKNLKEIQEKLIKIRNNPKLQLRTLDDLTFMHQFTFDNFRDLLIEQECVCIYCLERFKSTEINDFTNSKYGTALCPYCNIDSVIGEISGYEIDDSTLKELNHRFFNEEDKVSLHAESRLEFLFGIENDDISNKK